MIRSALYIDFDNFFGGLLAADPAAALELVERPSAWLQQLADTHTDGSERRWLVLRCYMNPAGSVKDSAAQDQRLYFSKFRPFFTQAGIEVIDCPSLTRGAKNGADIRIVIDVMAALRANTRYDEFVIASSDADFTPLLQVLRADDRRVTVIATGSTASAYVSLADRFLDEQDMLELVPRSEVVDLDGPPESEPTAEETPRGWRDADREAFSREVQDAYAAAGEPLNLSQLSTQLIQHLGEVATGSHWFGAGSFIKALRALSLPGAEFSQHYLWDTQRHRKPIDAAAAPQVSLPPPVSRFREVTKLPSIPSEYWPTVYRSLEAYAALHDFNLAQATKWSQDHAAGQGIEIPRPVFLYAVRGCRDGGTPLNGDPSPTADQIGSALLSSVLRQAATAGLEASEREKQILAEWLQVSYPHDGSSAVDLSS